MFVVLPIVQSTFPPPGVPRVEALFPFGPIHCDCPQLLLDVKVKVSPKQIGLVAVIVATGGFEFTVTCMVVSRLRQPQVLVTYKRYVPASTKVALTTLGLGKLEVKPFGPLQK